VQVMSALQNQPCWGDHRIFALAARQAWVFFNSIQRIFTGPAKNGKHGFFPEHVDSVISPLAFRYLAAIHPKKLVKFFPVKRDKPQM
jgi:hypothetical protein